ncbi:MAG: universal stress protein [Flavobacteriales bacterium]
MSVIKKILLTTDLSQASVNATDYALFFANKTGADIHLLYCYKPKYEELIAKKIAEVDAKAVIYGEITDFKHAAAFLLKRYTADIRMKLKKSSLHEHIVEGSFQDVVFEFIEQKNIDLVVMASQGINSIEDRIFGSNALKILRSSAAPVLIVPHNYDNVSVDDILYPTAIDNKDKAIEHYLAGFAELFEAQLTLLHIDDGRHVINAKDIVNFKRKALNFKYSNVISEIEPNVSVADGINEYIDNHKIDLLCITSHTTTLVDRFLKRSTVKSTLSKIRIPVLGFNETCLKVIEKKMAKMK